MPIPNLPFCGKAGKSGFGNVLYCSEPYTLPRLPSILHVQYGTRTHMRMGITSWDIEDIGDILGYPQDIANISWDICFSAPAWLRHL